MLSGYVKWEVVNATRSAGGLLTLWDSHSISVITSWKEEFSVGAGGGYGE